MLEVFLVFACTLRRVATRGQFGKNLIFKFVYETISSKLEIKSVQEHVYQL